MQHALIARARILPSSASLSPRSMRLLPSLRGVAARRATMSKRAGPLDQFVLRQPGIKRGRCTAGKPDDVPEQPPAASSAPWDEIIPQKPTDVQQPDQQKPERPAPRAAAAKRRAAPAAATAAGGALGALMSAARASAAAAKGAQQQAGSQLSPDALQQLAASNQAAVTAALSAAAAASRQPLLQELLVEPSWAELLAPEFAKPYVAQLQGFLEAEWAGGTVFPPQEAIFRALNSVPLEQVRVVILGQDPYINPGEAMGLSFSVPRGTRVPPSLANIYKELAADLGCAIPSHGCLDKWCRQGVLLLNAALTVRAKASNSHAGKGWEGLTRAALAGLVARRSGIVFLLWGKYAQERVAGLDMSRHHVLKSVHPSPLSAHRGFIGCRHFSATNRLLQGSGLPPVDWQIE